MIEHATMLEISETKIISTEACPCCGQSFVGRFDMCEVCGWENDYQQRDNPDMRGGANSMSLNEAKKAYAEGRTIY